MDYNVVMLLTMMDLCKLLQACGEEGRNGVGSWRVSIMVRFNQLAGTMRHVMRMTCLVDLYHCGIRTLY
jgi:hypothetical protein